MNRINSFSTAFSKFNTELFLKKILTSFFYMSSVLLVVFFRENHKNLSSIDFLTAVLSVIIFALFYFLIRNKESLISTLLINSISLYLLSFMLLNTENTKNAGLFPIALFIFLSQIENIREVKNILDIKNELKLLDYSSRIEKLFTLSSILFLILSLAVSLPYFIKLLFASKTFKDVMPSSVNSFIFLLISFLVFMLILCLFILYKRDDRTLNSITADSNNYKNNRVRTIESYKKPKIYLVVILLFLLSATMSSSMMYYRYKSLATPTYDFGLFAQMFHSMSENLTQVTTLERNGSLSHFKVHISPIFYLILPFYSIFKSPATLQIAQGVIVASGIFPLYLLLKNKKVSSFHSILLLLIYALHPVLLSSSGYDLHENCFLAPLILFLFYYVEKESPLGTAVFTLLTMMVKEDAPLYVMVVALYILLSKKKLKSSALMFFFAGLYFITCVYYLKNYGDGAMLGRFNNMISFKKLSLLSLPITVFSNISYVLGEVLKERKLEYILLTMLPLSYIPFRQKNLSYFVLLLPYFIMNLISDYQYQHSIHFQYNYGSTAFLIFMMVLYFSRDEKTKLIKDSKIMSYDKKSKSFSSNIMSIIEIIKRNKLISSSMALSFCIIFTISLNIRYQWYRNYYKDEKSIIVEMKKSMDEIPKKSGILASSFLTSYLSERDNLYDITYNLEGGEDFDADYVLIDLRPFFNENSIEYLDYYLSRGYGVEKKIPRGMIILKKKQ